MRVPTAVLMLMTLAGPAFAGCIVADPSPTPLNVRTAPYGRIVGTLSNGQSVRILDHSIDGDGRDWVYVGYGAGDPIGWVFRDFIVCKGEVR
jgi:hypothetical protein